MKEMDKSKTQLLQELELLRLQVAELKATEIERQQSAEMLIEERNLLRTLIDNLPDYIYFKDTNSRFITGNKALAQVMGARMVDELIGKTDFDFYPKDLATEYYTDEQNIIRSGQPLIAKEERLITPGDEQRWLSTTKVPLRNNAGQIVGLVGIGRDITERKQDREIQVRLLAEVTQQREQLRALTAQLGEAEELERKRLAQELHDQMGTNLTALGLNLNIVQTQIAAELPEVASIQSRLSDSLMLLEEIGGSIEDVVTNLRPPMLDDYGIVSALRWYGRHFENRLDIPVAIQGGEPEPRLPPAAEIALFRIVQEALTNVAKHAQADQITVTIATNDHLVYVTIFDDGIGFENKTSDRLPDPVGWGLLTMAERAEAIGGHCSVQSRPGEGTQVIVEIPQAGADAEDKFSTVAGR